jgi:hypothetical protein
MKKRFKEIPSLDSRFLSELRWINDSSTPEAQPARRNTKDSSYRQDLLESYLLRFETRMTSQTVRPRTPCG